MVWVSGGNRKNGPHCFLWGGSPCRLDSCELSLISCHSLVSALYGNLTLTHLCLSNNSLKTEDVRLLCQFMKGPRCVLQQLM